MTEKLTLRERYEIAERYLAGERQADLEREFGLSKRYTSKVVRTLNLPRRCWLKEQMARDRAMGL